MYVSIAGQVCSTLFLFVFTESQRAHGSQPMPVHIAGPSEFFFRGESCGDAWQSRAARLSHLVSFVGEPDAKAQILEPDRIMQLRTYVRAYVHM